MKKKVLFIDRDGTLIVEPRDTFQVDSLELLEFLPGVFRNLYKIRKLCYYDLIIVSNQDGLGTPSYPMEAYQLVQEKMLKAFSNEDIVFDEIYIDPSLPSDQSPNRKPGTGMLQKFFGEEYDLRNSFVIGDRLTDLELAKNLGANGILIGNESRRQEIENAGLQDYCVLIATHWDQISEYLLTLGRKSEIKRSTRETEIFVSLVLDGSGTGKIDTGIGFFDHMLDQVARHSGCNLTVKARGDLYVDEHHTVEDVALVLGEAFRQALGNMTGTQRYGFALPMDESQAKVLIDFGGRPSFVWKVKFNRDMIGNFPTEMFRHFFKSFSDAARCNLNITASGENDHHKAEAVFKTFARAIGMAIRKDPWKNYLPSTKGLI